MRQINVFICNSNHTCICIKQPLLIPVSQILYLSISLYHGYYTLVYPQLYLYQTLPPYPCILDAIQYISVSWILYLRISIAVSVLNNLYPCILDTISQNICTCICIKQSPPSILYPKIFLAVTSPPVSLYPGYNTLKYPQLYLYQTIPPVSLYPG